MPVAKVQVRANGALVSATTTVVNSGNSLATITNGNAVIVLVLVQSTSVAPTGVSDSGGNTYTADASAISISNAGTGNDGSRLYVYRSAGVAGSPTSVTATFGSAVAAFVIVYEVSGIRTTSPLDSGTPQNSGAAQFGTAASVSFTTTFADEFAIGFWGTSSNPVVTPGTGWNTFAANDGYTDSGSVYTTWRALSATGTFTADGTLASGAQWNAAVVSYQGLSGGGGGGTPTVKRLLGGMF